MATKGRICTRCVMDESDPAITFDSHGVCNHCHKYDVEKVLYTARYPADGLPKFVETLKTKNKNRPYDCVIGFSGGVDSSYLMHKAVKDWGLRVLAVHVDGGWNTEMAVSNIEKMVKKLGIRLNTIVIDWKEMRDLQRAFFKAQLIGQDTPQDHAFFASLYGFAVKNGAKDALNGFNLATESVMPLSWGHSPMDAVHLRSVHKCHGEIPLKKFPVVSFSAYHFIYPYFYRMKVHTPLNFLDFKKKDAVAFLEKEYGWKDYGWKHYESRFTKFFEAVYLIEKYGYDKRRAHLASLVLSGQTTREEALEILSHRPLTAQVEKEEMEYVASKLGFKLEQMKDFMKPDGGRSHLDYDNSLGRVDFFRKLKRLAKKFA